jgi:hypothetical protein
MAEKYLAALSWPYLHKPAFALVIKVEWDATNPGNDYKATAVKEAEEISLPAMFKLCLNLQEEYNIELWHGDAMNEAMVSLLFQGSNGKFIPLVPAPYINQPEATTLYLQAIRELTRSDNKLLWFGEESSLPGHLTNLPKDKPIDIAHYPAVCALGYAAAALYLWLQLEYEKKPKTAAQRIIEYCERVTSDEEEFYFPYDHRSGAEVAGYNQDEDEEGFFSKVIRGATMAENSAKKQRERPFKPGQSGNSKGKLKGALSHRRGLYPAFLSLVKGGFSLILESYKHIA